MIVSRDVGLRCEQAERSNLDRVLRVNHRVDGKSPHRRSEYTLEEFPVECQAVSFDQTVIELTARVLTVIDQRFRLWHNAHLSQRLRTLMPEDRHAGAVGDDARMKIAVAQPEVDTRDAAWCGARDLYLMALRCVTA
jgi:hypothetical protein